MTGPLAPPLQDLAESVTVAAQLLCLLIAGLLCTSALMVGLCRFVRLVVIRHEWRPYPEWGWAQRRQARLFAAAVTAGDLEAAEAPATRLLRANDAERGSARPRRCAWDESVFLPCSWFDVTSSLDLDAVAHRFGMQRHHSRDGSTEVRVGRRVRLRMIREEIAPGHGVTFVADTGLSVLEGHMRLRHVPAGGHHSPPGGVEVIVHAESTPSRQSRKVLRATRSVTRAGLRRWAREIRET
ncbi:MAG: hypothetical protein ACXIVQ_06445 [Acidimicrobiales bacterium]